MRRIIISISLFFLFAVIHPAHATTMCEDLYARGDWKGAVSACGEALQSGGGAGDAIALAKAHRALFELQPMLDAYREGIRRFGSLELMQDFARDLLAFNLQDEARLVIDEGLDRFPSDASLMELRAVSEAFEGRNGEACDWIRRSWTAGADPLSWAENTLFGERAFQSPYRELLDPRRLAADLPALPQERQAIRLRLLKGVMREEAGGAVTDLLLAGAPAKIQFLGIADLALLKEGSLPYLSDLLQSDDPSLRRKVLTALWDLNLPSSLPFIEEYKRFESDARNAAFADVLAAALKARATGEPAALEAIAGANPFRGLADETLTGFYSACGELEKAWMARERALAPPAVVPEPSQGPLQAYWECMERTDIQEMLELLEAHRTVRRIDARMYGLPRDDFDDQQNLTIAERLFLRSWSRAQGLDWPVEGQMQYPREIRHTLRAIARDTGLAPDCSGLLAEADPFMKALQRDGNELKLFEDTGADNEVNIVVNPYAQQYVVSTSNAYSTSANESYRSSNWGKTWTHGAVLGTGACDPVSYYNRNQVLYHCWLDGGIKMGYSSNNGQSWTSCTNLETAGMDRQDVYIDTFTGDGGTWPVSPCIDKIYVGYHRSGAQVYKYSTGTSAPFCNAWSSRLSIASPGNSGTIGTAITSSIGKTSGNGTAIYVFSRYASSGQGIYYSLSTDCGGTMTAPALIKALNNGGLFEWGIPSTNSRKVYVYPQADTDRQPLSAFRNNIYVEWNDLRTACTPPGASNTTCNSDIFVAKGVPNNRDNPTSWTWTNVNLTQNVVGTDSYTDEFYPSLSVDQADGSIYLSYYRTGSGASSITPRKAQVHYVMLRSIDGGTSWSPAYQVTQSSTDETGSGANLAMQWGDYTWIDAINGVSYPNWTDRREGADEDIWANKVCSEPSHWVERGGSPAAPPTTATPGANKVITVSWTLPDLYWGDGGEASGSRKFQLFVDGSLSQDNIAATTASAAYTASDCTTSHTFRVRAVNSCGVTKDYAAATATATGCSSTAPKEASPAGFPMTASKASGTAVRIAYTPGSCATSHAVYWRKLTGGITAPLTWANAACGVASGSTFDPGNLNAGEWIYFVVVGQSATKEGSFGRSFNGSTYAEEPEAVGVGSCDRAQDLTGTCP